MDDEVCECGKKFDDHTDEEASKCLMDVLGEGLDMEQEVHKAWHETHE